MFSHLIIDGYNIINKWPSLKKAKSKSLDFARQQFIDTVEKYSDYTGIKVTIVFDGKGEMLQRVDTLTKRPT